MGAKPATRQAGLGGSAKTPQKQHPYNLEIVGISCEQEYDQETERSVMGNEHKNMEIIDLTEKYKNEILRKGYLVEYEKSFPELFEHYFQYWADKNYFSPRLNEREVKERKTLLRSRLLHIKEQFREAGFDISRQKVVLFVGQDCTNGHAFKYKKDFVVWLPIEAYASEEQVDVFVTHEIIHALHYSQTPEFYFRSVMEKHSLARQLITEGLATYLTKEILGVSEAAALWADFLSEKERNDWMRACEEKRGELFGFVEKEFNAKNHNFFESNDPSDIYKYRGGYWVGLKIIENIAEQTGNSKELLKISRSEFEKLALSFLRQQKEI